MIGRAAVRRRCATHYGEHKNSRAMTFEHYYIDIPIPRLFLVLVIVVTGLWTWRRFR
jgi:hypothetical protein